MNIHFNVSEIPVSALEKFPKNAHVEILNLHVLSRVSDIPAPCVHISDDIFDACAKYAISQKDFKTVKKSLVYLNYNGKALRSVDGRTHFEYSI